jgi:hypothetical protein
MEPLFAAIKPYLSEGETYFFRPDKFYFELDVWETALWCRIWRL